MLLDSGRVKSSFSSRGEQGSPGGLKGPGLGQTHPEWGQQEALVHLECQRQKAGCTECVRTERNLEAGPQTFSHSLQGLLTRVKRGPAARPVPQSDACVTWFFSRILLNWRSRDPYVVGSITARGIDKREPPTLMPRVSW